MDEASRILVVDDEPTIRAVISRAFGSAGYLVEMADNGEDTLLAAKRSRPDVVILDLSLPDITGAEVCRRIRHDSSLQKVPIVILTGSTTDGLLVKCLDEGADDFMHKPFDIKELLARVNALLRRVPPEGNPVFTTAGGHITIDIPQRLITAGKNKIRRFSPKEFDLLVQIVQSSPHIVDKETLSQRVWGLPEKEVNPRTLDVHIRRIRQKLGVPSGSYLKTVPAIGYQWLEEA